MNRPSAKKDEAREVGEKAAQFAIWHDQDGSITIQRTGNYSVDYRIVPLEQIAAKTKVMPAEFLTADGNNTTWDFYNYGRPLLGSGFPNVHRIRAPQVGKILGNSRKK